MVIADCKQGSKRNHAGNKRLLFVYQMCSVKIVLRLQFLILFIPRYLRKGSPVLKGTFGTFIQSVLLNTRNI